MEEDDEKEKKSSQHSFKNDRSKLMVNFLPYLWR